MRPPSAALTAVLVLMVAGSLVADVVLANRAYAQPLPNAPQPTYASAPSPSDGSPGPEATPSPEAFPHDVAVAWCQLGSDLSALGAALPQFSDGEPADLATAQAAVATAAPAVRKAADALRSNLQILQTWEPTATYGAGFETLLRSVEESMQALSSATDEAALGYVVSVYTHSVEDLVSAFMWSGMGHLPGEPADCRVFRPATPPPPPTPKPTSRVSTTGWRLVELPGGGRIHDVISTARGFLAVGGSDEAAVVWTSSDGMTWDRVPATAAFAGGSMSAVAAGGPGFVAVGTAGGEGSATHAAVWTSLDGRSWTRVPDAPVFADPEDPGVSTSMTGLAVAGRRIVAIGDVFMGAVWTSTDGFRWERARRFDAGGGVNGVVAGGPGFVAVGGYGALAFAWVSSNGLDWDKVEMDGLQDTALALTVAPDGTFVATGQLSEPNAEVAVAWTSSDGRTWRRAPSVASLPPGVSVPSPGPDSVVKLAYTATMRAVTTFDQGFVAVGGDTIFEPLENKGAIWTSSDGKLWAHVPEDPVFDNASLDGVFEVGGRLLVVGSVWDDPALPVGAAWVSAAHPAAAGGSLTPTASQQTSEATQVIWPLVWIVALAACLGLLALRRAGKRWR